MNDLPVFTEKPVKKNGEWSMFGKLKGNTGTSIGIDPGVRYGMTVISGEEVAVYWGSLPPEGRTGYRGLLAYEYALRNSFVSIRRAVVEGAAYFYMKGQVGLEEIRFGFFLGLHHNGHFVDILPPATVRKLAFGGGRIMATDLWPDLNQNGLDSIGCALAALRMDTNGD